MALCCRYQPDGLCTDLRKYIDGPSHYLTLPPDLKSAVEAICYIAEQLQAEKDYEAVRDSFTNIISTAKYIFGFSLQIVNLAVMCILSGASKEAN